MELLPAPAAESPADTPMTAFGTRGQHLAFLALAILLFMLGLFTLRGFLDALAWAGIFAIALWPLYCRARSRVGPRTTCCCRWRSRSV